MDITEIISDFKHPFDTFQCLKLKLMFQSFMGKGEKQVNVTENMLK